MLRALKGRNLKLGRALADNIRLARLPGYTAILAIFVSTIPVLNSVHAKLTHAPTEVEQRTGLRWPIFFGSNNTWNGSTVTLSVQYEVEVAYQSSHAEGYTLSTSHPGTVVVEGTDARGLLFGIGRLLRVMHLNLTQNYYTPRSASATVVSDLVITSRFCAPLRRYLLVIKARINQFK